MLVDRSAKVDFALLKLMGGALRDFLLFLLTITFEAEPALPMDWCNAFHNFPNMTGLQTLLCSYKAPPKT